MSLHVLWRIHWCGGLRIFFLFFFNLIFLLFLNEKLWFCDICPHFYSQSGVQNSWVSFHFSCMCKSDVFRHHSVIYLLLRNQSQSPNEDRWAMKLMLFILLYSLKLYLFCLSTQQGFPRSRLCGVCASLWPWVTWKHTSDFTLVTFWNLHLQPDPHICWVYLWKWTTRRVCFVWLPDLWRM